MGMYSQIVYNIELSEDKIDEFDKAFQLALEKTRQIENGLEPTDSWESYWIPFITREGNQIRFTTDFSKFYHEEDFMGWIAPFVGEGFIDLIDEDGSKVEYRFENGNYEVLISVLVPWSKLEDVLRLIRGKNDYAKGYFNRQCE